MSWEFEYPQSVNFYYSLNHINFVVSLFICRPRWLPRTLSEAVREISLSVGADATHVCDIKGRWDGH